MSIKSKLPLPFIFRRLHSLLGIWLVIYVFEHLLVNAQMAFPLQEGGSNFVRMVNTIHTLPYLKAIELLFIGAPLLVHGVWGIHYALTSRSNAFSTSWKRPSLGQYKRNRAFSWQRITSWVLLIGIALHVWQMRFLEYPTHLDEGGTKVYFVRVPFDTQLPPVAADLGATLYREFAQLPEEVVGKPLKQGEVVIEAPSAGAAFYFVVRATFHNPWMVVLYSLFVVAAAYHAFNGLWTALITWGVTLTRRAQRRARMVTSALMWVVMVLGLMACWGPYWAFVWA